LIHPFVISRAGLLYLFDNGDLLAPSEGKQIETGLRYQPVGTTDLYTLSLFRISQENLASQLPEHQLTLWTGYRF
jgi:outer membrane receptor for ferric coprogen and ferric-rhodotorulic acid